MSREDEQFAADLDINVDETAGEAEPIGDEVAPPSLFPPGSLKAKGEPSAPSSSPSDSRRIGHPEAKPAVETSPKDAPPTDPARIDLPPEYAAVKAIAAIDEIGDILKALPPGQMRDFVESVQTASIAYTAREQAKLEEMTTTLEGLVKDLRDAGVDVPVDQVKSFVQMANDRAVLQQALIANEYRLFEARFPGLKEHPNYGKLEKLIGAADFTKVGDDSMTLADRLGVLAEYVGIEKGGVKAPAVPAAPAPPVVASAPGSTVSTPPTSPTGRVLPPQRGTGSPAARAVATPGRAPLPPPRVQRQPGENFEDAADRLLATVDWGSVEQ